MAYSRQTALIIGLIENAPTIVFFCVLYGLQDLRLAGWIALPLALAVCGAYALRKIRPNTIMIGVNLYVVSAVVAGEALLLMGERNAAILLADNALSLVLVAIFAVGCALTIFSESGFAGVKFKTRSATIQASCVLLGANGLGIAWASFVEAERFLEVGIPLMALFGTQRFLIAKALDDEGGANNAKHWVAAGAVSSAELDQPA